MRDPFHAFIQACHHNNWMCNFKMHAVQFVLMLPSELFL